MEEPVNVRERTTPVAGDRRYRKFRRESLEAITETVAARIQWHVDRMDLSDRQVANAIDCPEKNIARWRRGEYVPSLDYLVLLADLFDTTTDDLLGRVSRG